MERASISKNRLFFWAILIAILNPFFSGIILGLVMLSEPELRKEGKMVSAFSMVWGVLALALLAKFKHLLPF